VRREQPREKALFPHPRHEKRFERHVLVHRHVLCGPSNRRPSQTCSFHFFALSRRGRKNRPTAPAHPQSTAFWARPNGDRETENACTAIIARNKLMHAGAGRAVFAMLCIWKFHRNDAESTVKHIPYEIAEMVARALWETRGDVDWIPDGEQERENTRKDGPIKMYRKRGKFG
jgi:hypothetical protein